MLTHHAVGDNLQTKLDFKDRVSINYRRYGAVARRVCRLSVGYVVASVSRIMFDIDWSDTFTVCLPSPENWSSTATVDEFGSA